MPWGLHVRTADRFVSFCDAGGYTLAGMAVGEAMMPIWDRVGYELRVDRGHCTWGSPVMLALER